MTTRARLDFSDRTDHLPTRASNKAKIAAAAFWTSPSVKVFPVETVVYPKIVHDKGFYESRRLAIYYIYVHTLGQPTMSPKVCHQICEVLQIPKESRRRVTETVTHIVESTASGGNFSGKYKRKRAVRHLEELSDQAAVVYRCSKANLSVNETVYNVNTWREWQEPPLKPLSFSTVERFMSSSECIKTTTRKKVKSGKTDPTSEWAQGKLLIIFVIKRF